MSLPFERWGTAKSAVGTVQFPGWGDIERHQGVNAVEQNYQL